METRLQIESFLMHIQALDRESSTYECNKTNHEHLFHW